MVDSKVLWAAVFSGGPTSLNSCSIESAGIQFRERKIEKGLSLSQRVLTRVVTSKVRDDVLHRLPVPCFDR
jgi:hypothetical protein